MSFDFVSLKVRLEEDLRCKTVMRMEYLDGKFECKRADGGGGGGANINCDEAEAQKRKGKDERERALVVST